MQNEHAPRAPRVERRLFLRTLGVLGVSGVAGCGDDGGDTPTATATVTPTPTTRTNEATPTPTSNQDLPPDPPSMLSFSGGNALAAGDTATLTARLQNPYLFAVQSVSVTLTPPSDTWELSAASPTSFEEIPFQEAERLAWEIAIPEDAQGDYTFTGTISYETETDRAEVDFSYSVTVWP